MSQVLSQSEVDALLAAVSDGGFDEEEGGGAGGVEASGGGGGWAKACSGPAAWRAVGSVVARGSAACGAPRGTAGGAATQNAGW